MTANPGRTLRNLDVFEVSPVLMGYGHFTVRPTQLSDEESTVSVPFGPTTFSSTVACTCGIFGVDCTAHPHAGACSCGTCLTNTAHQRRPFTPNEPMTLEALCPHDYRQAKGTWEHQLYCRYCADVKTLDTDVAAPG